VFTIAAIAGLLHVALGAFALRHLPKGRVETHAPVSGVAVEIHPG
jgi:uncharacterized membrane protein YgdD (TMEM256/DUF423 family)